jgi:hypothetical protein
VVLGGRALGEKEYMQRGAKPPVRGQSASGTDGQSLRGGSRGSVAPVRAWSVRTTDRRRVRVKQVHGSGKLATGRGPCEGVVGGVGVVGDASLPAAQDRNRDGICERGVKGCKITTLGEHGAA